MLGVDSGKFFSDQAKACAALGGLALDRGAQAVWLGMNAEVESQANVARPFENGDGRNGTITPKNHRFGTYRCFPFA
jgi:hypothetical protein